LNYFYKLIVDNHLGDIASVIGILISLIGFFITIWNVIKSRKAAQKAEEIVQKVREDISKIETIEEFSKAIATIDEIKRLNRDGAWPILPERYSALRKSLISIKISNPNMPENDKVILSNALRHTSNMEDQIEKFIIDKSLSVDISKFNKIISQQGDRLTEILVSLKGKIGR
jgi:cell division protein FtsX